MRTEKQFPRDSITIIALEVTLAVMSDVKKPIEIQVKLLSDGKNWGENEVESLKEDS